MLWQRPVSNTIVINRRDTNPLECVFQGQIFLRLVGGKEDYFLLEQKMCLFCTFQLQANSLHGIKRHYGVAAAAVKLPCLLW